RRPSLSAVPPSGNRLSSPHQPWTGRPCVRSVGRPIPSGVPPVASDLCVRVSSRVAVRPRRCWLGSGRHEVDPPQAAGGKRPGEGVPGGGSAVAQRGRGSSLEGSAGQIGGLLTHREGGQGRWPVG